MANEPEPPSIEYVPVAEDAPPGHAAGAPAEATSRLDLFRLVVAACAVVVALSFAVEAWAALRSTRLEDRQACISAQQSALFGPFGQRQGFTQSEWEVVLDHCGVDVPDELRGRDDGDDEAVVG